MIKTLFAPASFKTDWFIFTAENIGKLIGLITSLTGNFSLNFSCGRNNERTIKNCLETRVKTIKNNNEMLLFELWETGGKRD